MRTNRSLTIQGEHPIRIVRDQHGVVHVQARIETDLYRGLGYCHAMDRGLQLLVLRLVGQGRASEWLDASDEMLALDVFFRRLNLGAGAGAEIAKLPPRHRALVEAYAAGVNTAFRRRVPWELKILGYAPEPWTPADSVGLSRVTGYVALAQSQGEMEHLLLEMIQAGVPHPHLAELFPGLPEDLDVDLLRRVRLGDRVVPESVRWSCIVPRAIASNNWVLAGDKTTNGCPLLANDPHLEVNRLPAMWYEVVLELGDRYCIGATMPGLPAAVLGRTNDLAWGATYTFMDAVDSWIEDCREGHYRRLTMDGETWEPFRERTEIIRRRKKPPVTVVFHENSHGVLQGNPAEPGLYLATRWAAEATGGASIEAAVEMLQARDVAEGMELLGRIETAWNFVLADRHGNIGYQMSGRMPVRKKGHNGLVPLPGWDPDNDWQGFVPPSDLPRTINPDCGFIVTANNDLNHLGRAKPINLPMGAYRAARISTLLASRNDWDVRSTQRMHMDVESPQAALFMDALRSLLPPTPNGELLRNWDLQYDPDSRGASLFERFYRELVVEVFGAVCGTAAIRFVMEETPIVVDFFANFDQVLLRPDSLWYGREGRDAVFRRVAGRVLSGSARRWGETQQTSMRHLLFGKRVPAWLGFEYGPVPLRGGRATIHQGQVYKSRGRETTFAPSYRLVTDLGESAVWTCLAGGPSDRRFSRWYTSDIRSWLSGEFKRVAPSGAPVP